MDCRYVVVLILQQSVRCTQYSTVQYSTVRDLCGPRTQENEKLVRASRCRTVLRAVANAHFVGVVSPSRCPDKISVPSRSLRGISVPHPPNQKSTPLLEDTDAPQATHLTEFRPRSSLNASHSAKTKIPFHHFMVNYGRLHIAALSSTPVTERVPHPPKNNVS